MGVGAARASELTTETVVGMTVDRAIAEGRTSYEAGTRARRVAMAAGLPPRKAPRIAADIAGRTIVHARPNARPAEAAWHVRSAAKGAGCNPADASTVGIRLATQVALDKAVDDGRSAEHVGKLAKYAACHAGGPAMVQLALQEAAACAAASCAKQAAMEGRDVAEVAAVARRAAAAGGVSEITIPAHAACRAVAEHTSGTPEDVAHAVRRAAEEVGVRRREAAALAAEHAVERCARRPADAGAAPEAVGQEAYRAALACGVLPEPASAFASATAARVVASHVAAAGASAEEVAAATKAAAVASGAAEAEATEVATQFAVGAVLDQVLADGHDVPARAGREAREAARAAGLCPLDATRYASEKASYAVAGRAAVDALEEREVVAQVRPILGLAHTQSEHVIRLRGCRVFRSWGGVVDRAPENSGGGAVREKGSIDRTINRV